jgi:hypothetical protein
MKLGSTLASLVLLGTACSITPDSTGERARMSAQAMMRADHESLSDPNVPGPLSSTEGASREGDNHGTPCGPSRCKAGQFCCNESCGLCAPHGGVCLQRQCGPSSVALTECTSDSDCRAFSSYCDGCQCLGCGLLDPDPSCHATMVACILDPCHHQHPACLEGVCAVVDD